MYSDFKEIVILLAQHPISRKPITQLDKEEKDSAFDLLQKAADLIVDDEYTQFDYIQMARISFNLAELGNSCGDNKEQILACYRNACRFLARGGIDLSMSKWMEILSLRTMD